MNKELWEKILQFDLDHPVSEYGFTTRLAHENFWTKQFTESAIIEYKKFMYLAATSEFMVSPSEIVDTVWHQHLIFTQSYQDFCGVLGKQVQHIPSTHNRNEFEKFRQAKERTTKLYNSVFGEQPKDVWDYSDMYDSLELPKARLKIRSFILLGILLFLIVLPPFYLLLKPVYADMETSTFFPAFISLTFVTLIFLEIYNGWYLKQCVNKISKFSFIHQLSPSEVIYLETQKLSNVIHPTMNDLITNRVVKIQSDYTMEHTTELKVNTVEEHQMLDVLHHMGRTNYASLMKQLLTKHIFKNVSNCMDALKKYFTKSRTFGKLFYINFFALQFLLLLGTVRLSTGILRHKPVVYISVVLIILLAIIVAYLWRLTRLFCTNTIPQLYKNDIRPETNDDNQWRYFFSGNAVMAVLFLPVVEKFNRANSNAFDGTTSACGSSCSSCGSSCGGCGGCGGGD